MPIDLNAFRDHPPSVETLHKLTDEIMRVITDEVSALRAEIDSSRNLT